MSDDSVRGALRSDSLLVLVEAPAGCGKTHQGSDYAREMATKNCARLLILTHTHAACSTFSDRTKGIGPRIEIRTIDSVIGQIASVYYAGLGLPRDVAGWVRQRKKGHEALAVKVASLLKKHPMIAASLARRYPVVICDEHQDSSGDQHATIMSLFDHGAKLRIFADPMQKIFENKAIDGGCPPCDWNELTSKAQAFERLDMPHRWAKGCPDLGEWTLKAREALRTGGKVNLRVGLPPSISVVVAENQAQKRFDYRLSSGDRKSVDDFEKEATVASDTDSLQRHGDVAAKFFQPSHPAWEGHQRTGLETLVDAVHRSEGDCEAVATAVVAFMDKIGKGFSPSAFGNGFKREAREGCTASRRGKPAKIQQLARYLVADANHRGVANMLRRLWELKDTDGDFSDIEIDCSKEYWDAIRLGAFTASDIGLAEITHHRTYSHPKPPAKAISNIHKAKGLECGSVVIMPCDAGTFPNKHEARCLLYVAISRAKDSLMFVVSRANPCALLEI